MTNGQTKIRQRACKLCSFMAKQQGGKRGKNTYPGAHTDRSGKKQVDAMDLLYSANLLCCTDSTSAILHLACFQVWHRELVCGRDFPTGATIQLRNPGRKRARTLDLSVEECKGEREEEEEEEEEEVEEEQRVCARERTTLRLSPL